MNGACNGKEICPATWGLVKRSNIIKFQYQSQSQMFLCKTLCVFLQIEDTKDIKRDIYCDAWVMPQGWDLGDAVGGGGDNE